MNSVTRCKNICLRLECVHSLIHTVCKYTKSSPPGFFNLVPLYSLIVGEEELMNVAESPLRTGEETGEKRRGQKPWRGGRGAGEGQRVVEGRSLGATVLIR